MLKCATFQEVKAIVESCQTINRDSTDEKTKRLYTNEGGVVTYYPSTKTVLIQGKQSSREKIADAFNTKVKMVQITRNELDRLEIAALELDCLYTVGVDSWFGYNEAMEDFQELKKKRRKDDARNEHGRDIQRT